MANLDSIGCQIRKLREATGMPLRKLAAQLDIDQSTLSKIERGERRPKAQMLAEIANIFQADKKSLFVTFYSDIVAQEIQEEISFSEILQVAEAKIEYQRNKTKQTK